MIFFCQPLVHPIHKCYYFLMRATSYFFGYGANRNGNRLREILNKGPLEGSGAIAEGFDLGIQTLNQIPEDVQKILRRVWGNSFRAYTLVPGKGIVSGAVWTLDEEDFRVIKDFEFIDQWSKFEVIKVKKFNGEIIEAITTRVFDNAEISEIVDGINYIDNLNGERLKQTKNTIGTDDEYRIKKITNIKNELKRFLFPKNNH